MTDSSTHKKMKLRYAGACRHCEAALPAGQVAVYDRAAKNVLCLGCSIDPPPEPGEGCGVVPPLGHTVSPPPAATASPLDASSPGQHAAALEWPVASETHIASLVDGVSAAPSNAYIAAGAAFAASPAELAESAAQAMQAAEDHVIVGAPGASARREHERRKNRREQRVRAAHPRLGGLILALSDDPQSTRAWDVGARGEERLGKGLNALADRGVRTLHDRRIPRTKANIDHIAVAPSGVYVIDAKRYQGRRPALRVEGGLLRARTEKLVVGGRDQTKLVHGMDKQVRLVREALALTTHGHVTVHGMLCFVDADWPLLGGSFTISGHHVLWPKKAFNHLTQPGHLDPPTIEAVLRALATHFPQA